MRPTIPNTSGLLQRIVDAVENVRQRMLRATTALRSAGIEHAVLGGNAIAAWVKTIDPAGVRTTLDVDILVRRDDFERVKAALTAAGFVYRHSSSLDMFLDHATASPREAIHILFAGENVKSDQPVPNPDVGEAVEMDSVRFLTLEALVRNKLASFRRKDQVHIQDLIEIGLIDPSWTGRLTPILAARLQSLLDDPGG